MVLLLGTVVQPALVPWILMKGMKAMITFWCQQGVMCMVSINDFVVLPSKEELWWIRD